MSGPEAAGYGPLIHRRYLFGLLLRLCVNFAVGVGILFVILYFALSRPLPGDYAGIFHALRNLSPSFRAILSVSVLLYALLACGSTSALCVYILHKVAGPLYRMELVLDQYRSGAPTRTVSFRNGDQLQALAQACESGAGLLPGSARTLAEPYHHRLQALRVASQLGVVRLARGAEERLKRRVVEPLDEARLQDEATCHTKMEEALRKVAGDMGRYH